ncbi:hypothetical protein [Xanthomonas albilineans]|uniref:DUF7940 domain-containing protein n=1 Tax=Xanthomonas albilineans TaxID=29447 RepID=UPI0005F3187D|nr:hypothetical protein [Xanthomonas albilineans]
MRLIDDWHRAYRLASVQVFAAIALLPDAYNGIAALGWLDELPGPAKWTIRAAGAIGVIARLVRQRNTESKS